MLKEAIKYIVGLAEPIVEVYDNQWWSNQPLHRVSFNPKAKTIGMTTLSSLVDYIKSNVDNIETDMIIHVQSPTKVQMYSALDDERIREYMVEVNAQLPTFEFNRFIDHESFCINLQSKFLPNEDRALLLKFAGTVEGGTIAEYGDDGITQKATIKTGIASKGEAIIPNPVLLKPFRTFIEIEQPSSRFIFRMRGDSGIQCALYEADGGAWKSVAMNRIKDFLVKQLGDLTEHFTVIC